MRLRTHLKVFAEMLVQLQDGRHIAAPARQYPSISAYSMPLLLPAKCYRE